MERMEFLEELIAAVESEIPMDLKDDIEVEVNEVVKTNDEKLHGISVHISGNNIAPTIYLEDCLKEHEKGTSIDDIAKGIISSCEKHHHDTKHIGNISLAYEDIESKLTVQLVEAERNKERLKDLVYRPVGNGFVFIPYVEVAKSEKGSMRFAVTKEAAGKHGYDVEKLMDTAFANTVEKERPEFCEILSMITGIDDAFINRDPTSAGFSIDASKDMYVLTCTNKQNGASTLFYPCMQKMIGDILMDDYYVLPSSLHEVIIVPKRDADDIRMLQDIVKDINSSFVAAEDILSDRIFLYDREKQKLIEPEAKERKPEERGQR